MNERKLRIFYEVAVSLNMTQAANKLYISQPAISQTIKELEDDLCVKLFDRIGRRIYLTNEGRVFLNYARRILNIYDEGVKRIREIGDAKAGELRIGASTTIGIYVLPDIIGNFIKKYSNVDVSITIENTRLIQDLILNNEIDFAYVEGPVSTDEVEVVEFCDDELVFITAYDHPWRLKEKISLEDISREKIIMREEGSGTREVFESLLNSKGVNFQIAFELGNTEAIKKAVEVGLGISCISKRCIKREFEMGSLSYSKINGIAIARKFNLIYHRDKYISPLFKTFIDFAKDTYK